MQQPNYSRHNIIIIDDEKDIRFAVSEILKENKYLVREADTIEKALFEKRNQNKKK